MEKDLFLFSPTPGTKASRRLSTHRLANKKRAVTLLGQLPRNSVLHWVRVCRPHCDFEWIGSTSSCTLPRILDPMLGLAFLRRGLGGGPHHTGCMRTPNLSVFLGATSATTSSTTLCVLPCGCWHQKYSRARLPLKLPREFALWNHRAPDA